MSNYIVNSTRLAAVTDVLFGMNPAPSQIKLAMDAITAGDVQITNREAVERAAKSIYMDQLAVKENDWENLPTRRKIHFINVAMNALRAARETNN